jgi:hypothetical protein
VGCGESSRVLRSFDGEQRTGGQRPRGALNVEAPGLQPQRHEDVAMNVLNQLGRLSWSVFREDEGLDVAAVVRS